MHALDIPCTFLTHALHIPGNSLHIHILYLSLTFLLAWPLIKIYICTFCSAFCAHFTGSHSMTNSLTDNIPSECYARGTKYACIEGMCIILYTRYVYNITRSCTPAQISHTRYFSLTYLLTCLFTYVLTYLLTD